MTPLVSAEEIGRRYPNADEDMLQRIRRAVALVNEQAHPQGVQAHFDVDDSLCLCGYTPSGKDVKAHLAGSTAVVVGVCTIGATIDRLIERTKVSDLATAYFVDLAASYAVENLAERECARLGQQCRQEGLLCTTRYSCGYGDFDLRDQPTLLALSGADKAMRIQVNDGGMMYPTKTITYMVGLIPARTL